MASIAGGTGCVVALADARTAVSSLVRVRGSFFATFGVSSPRAAARHVNSNTIIPSMYFLIDFMNRRSLAINAPRSSVLYTCRAMTPAELLNLARQYQSGGQLEEAETAFRQLATLFPSAAP